MTKTRDQEKTDRSTNKERRIKGAFIETSFAASGLKSVNGEERLA
jgi:hypothetical protein